MQPTAATKFGVLAMRGAWDGGELSPPFASKNAVSTRVEILRWRWQP